MSDREAVPLGDRRATGERRRYNRRSAPDPGSPPYYEVFERIATALESIEQSLRRDSPAASRTQPVRPRGVSG